jgi:hypothetical protein
MHNQNRSFRAMPIRFKAQTPYCREELIGHSRVNLFNSALFEIAKKIVCKPLQAI